MGGCVVVSCVGDSVCGGTLCVEVMGNSVWGIMIHVGVSCGSDSVCMWGTLLYDNYDTETILWCSL